MSGHIKKQGESMFIARSPHPWTDFDDLYVTWRVCTKVPSGGRVDTVHHIGVEIPQKPFNDLEDVNKHIKTPILTKLLRRLQPNFAQ